MKGKTVIRVAELGFTKDRSFLASFFLSIISSQKAVWMKKGRRSGKLLSAVALSHSVLVWKLRNCILGERNIRFECCTRLKGIVTGTVFDGW